MRIPAAFCDDIAALSRCLLGTRISSILVEEVVLARIYNTTLKSEQGIAFSTHVWVELTREASPNCTRP